MDCAIYLRQSQDRTGQELGVSRQREDCRKLAALRGWTVVAECVDNDVSAAGKRRRPGFEQVLDTLSAGKAQCVVAWDMSRLTRNARDRLRLLEAGKKHKVIVAFVRGSEIDLGTPAGRLTADILGSVALHEIEQKADRQRRAAQQAAEQGKRVGGRRPFGYEQDGVTLREHEAIALTRAYESLLNGVPLGRIAAELDAAGLHTPQTTRAGRPSQWTAQSLRPVLLNPRYAGLRAHVTADLRESLHPAKARLAGIVIGQDGLPVQAEWPALVDEETWRAAVSVLTDPGRVTAPKSGVALLTGWATCAVCGATVHGGRQAKRLGGHKTYRCSDSYGHLTRAQAPVDDHIGRVVIGRLCRSDAADLLVDDQRPDAGALRTQAATIRQRLDSLAADFADGELTPAQIRTATQKLLEKLADIESQQAYAGRTDVLGPLILASDPKAVWEATSVDVRRLVASTLMRVTLLPPGRGTRTFRAETVRIEWVAG